MQVAVVIPCYAVANSILKVLQDIPELVDLIVCVDDACPENTGNLIETSCADNRVIVLRHTTNQGVGGSVVTGYKEALRLGAEIVVKLDGDGQMAPQDIQRLVRPIQEGKADYTKGNRFYLLSNLRGMPLVRLTGNVALSFLSKMSTGYWKNFDPTNGFTAIHRNVLRSLPLNDLHKRYFFESDMLYQLSTLRAVVFDVPQRAVYADETSHLKIGRSIPLFLILHLRNFAKRVFYNYFLRDFHLASVELLLGPILLCFGLMFGAGTWSHNVALGVETPVGTVMLAVLPILVGLQLLLSAVGFDMDNQPTTPIYPQLDFDV